jgi:hypothetical protein
MISRQLRVLAIMTVGVVMLSATAALAASTPPGQGKIGHNQIFVGLVNGKSGINRPAQVLVACPGPIVPGEMTHPLAHQPLEVDQPEVIETNFGYTGPFATHISAFLGIPPTAGDTGGIATFTRYGKAVPIPTTLDVPCSGSGFITFLPLPRDPGTSRAYVVPIDYVNIAT